MRIIHLTADDLARVRLKSSLGMVAETVFAMNLFGQPTPPSFASWRKQTARSLRDSGALDADRIDGEWEALLRLVDRSESADDFVLQVLGRSDPRPDRPTVRGLVQMWRAGVAPHWNRLLGHLEAECEVLGRIAMRGGVELLLGSLHPQIVWEPPVLKVPGGPSGRVFLEGRGLVLSPSVFLSGAPGRLVGAEQPALVFGAPPDAHLWDGPDAGEEALGALVGQTRAAVLRTLRATYTTGQLAERLGISAAGASQHTAVLRRTGLITTRRIRNTVLHTATPLGMALLNG